MDYPVLNLLELILEEAAGPSWHQETRRDLGIPEECGPEPLLCLTLTRSGVPMVPVAFVLEDGHLGDVSRRRWKTSSQRPSTPPCTAPAPWPWWTICC